MMKLWQKEDSLVPLENEAFSLKNGFLAFKKKITIEEVKGWT